jgi:hypothetical protein
VAAQLLFEPGGVAGQIQLGDLLILAQRENGALDQLSRAVVVAHGVECNSHIKNFRRGKSQNVLEAKKIQPPARRGAAENKSKGEDRKQSSKPKYRATDNSQVF